jgi:hypothetical protein
MTRKESFLLAFDQAATVRVRSLWTDVLGTATKGEPYWTIRWDDGEVDTDVVSLLDPDFEVIG